jgi:hypothetical protein
MRSTTRSSSDLSSAFAPFRSPGRLASLPWRVITGCDTAERLVRRLEASGFVLMKRPLVKSDSLHPSNASARLRAARTP